MMIDFNIPMFFNHRAAMMSGSVLAPWAHQVNPKANARILANNLRCFDTHASSLLQCLQVKINIIVCITFKKDVRKFMFQILYNQQLMNYNKLIFHFLFLLFTFDVKRFSDVIYYFTFVF